MHTGKMFSVCCLFTNHSRVGRVKPEAVNLIGRFVLCRAVIGFGKLVHYDSPLLPSILAGRRF